VAGFTNSTHLPDRHRFDALDSLRGIAALIVLFHHCLFTYRSVIVAISESPAELSDAPLLRTLIYSPLHLLWDGGDAVLFFFVLSGFVLALPFLDETGAPGYRPYLVRRFCRIYLPFAAAIFVAAAACRAVSPRTIEGLSVWFNEHSWNHPVTAKLVVGHLLMTGSFTYRSLENVVWSLVHEVRISLVFPLMMLALRRGTASFLVATLAASAVAYAWEPDLVDEPALINFCQTVQYLGFFAVGAALAKHRDVVCALLARLSPATTAGLILLALTCVSWRWQVARLPGMAPAPLPEAMAGLGAALWIALAIGSSRVAAVLELAPLRWLGRVSYSLYLIHLVLLLSAVHLLYGRLPLWEILAAVILASLVAAELMHRWVEVPAMTLGRRLTRRRRFPDEAIAMPAT
jgi:peptidoglycan/LPS O-acetylase OafA/YrhL